MFQQGKNVDLLSSVFWSHFVSLFVSERLHVCEACGKEGKERPFFNKTGLGDVLE